MQINTYLNAIVLILIPGITNQADFEKTIYTSDLQFINSVTCVCVSFYFKSNGDEDNGQLVVRLNEASEDGQATGWITEIDHIPLRSKFADKWTYRAKTIHFDHAEIFIVSVVHKIPMVNESGEVKVKVTLEKNPCKNESPIDQPIVSTQPPMTTLKGTESTINSVETSSPCNYFTETSSLDEGQTTIRSQTETDSNPTKLDTSSTQFDHGPVSTETPYSSIGTTIVSTTNSSIVTMSSTINIITETTSIDTKQSITSQSVDNEIATISESDQPDTKTGNFFDDLIAIIKLFSDKRYSIPLIAALFGLIIMTISLTFLISRNKRKDYRLKNRDLIVSTSSNGIDLNTIKVHKQTIN